MKSWERKEQKINKDLKNQVLSSLKKRIDPKKLRKECEKSFDLRKIISRQFLGNVALGHFVCGNNAWGYNQHTMHMNYYKIFKKEYDENKFEKKIFDLLVKSKNKTPQTTVTRKLPFKQKRGGSHEPALPGKEIIYSNKHEPKNPYIYKYCNRTGIDFFKGPLNEAKKITEQGYEKIFSYAFMYGYIEAAATIRFKLGALDESVFNKPRFRRHWHGVNWVNMFYDKRSLKNKKINFFKKFYKISESKSEEIINDIENSIFQSTLSNFLLAKNENYFVYMFEDYPVGDGEEIDDTIDRFFADLQIHKKENNYNKGHKYDRINKIFNKTRREKYLPTEGCPAKIFNYELFRFYTLRCKHLEPFDVRKLNLNERDIFIRYAIYMGVQEINYYINQIIFSAE